MALDKPISYSSIREAFKRDLKSVGADPSKFGLHSLRSGGATMAANSGVNDRVFQRHGRWKSVQAKDTYVDDDLHKGFQFPNFLGFNRGPIKRVFAQYFVPLCGVRAGSCQALPR